MPPLQHELKFDAGNAERSGNLVVQLVVFGFGDTAIARTEGVTD